MFEEITTEEVMNWATLLLAEIFLSFMGIGLMFSGLLLVLTMKGIWLAIGITFILWGMFCFVLFYKAIKCYLRGRNEI